MSSSGKLSRLEWLAPVVLLLSLPGCLLGYVGLAISTDDLGGRWTLDAILPLLLFSYFPLGLVAFGVAIFLLRSESVRRVILTTVVWSGAAVLALTAALIAMPSMFE